jgi:hypothetical protein
MSYNAVAREKYLINCPDETNNSERATIFFIFAFTASKHAGPQLLFRQMPHNSASELAPRELRQKAMSPYRIYPMAFWKMVLKFGSV